MYSFLAMGSSSNCVIYCPYILPDRSQNLLQDICGVGSVVHTEVAPLSLIKVVQAYIVADRTT